MNDGSSGDVDRNDSLAFLYVTEWKDYVHWNKKWNKVKKKATLPYTLPFHIKIQLMLNIL